MPKRYRVRPGDCISSLACKHGLLPETIWNHPENRSLKKDREDGHILLPGDILFIPDKQTTDRSCPTERKHRFRRKAVPEKLRIRFLDQDGKPRSGTPYVLKLDSQSGRSFVFKEGVTDSNGILEESISPDASRGTVILQDREEEEYEVMLGHMDPLDEISGVQARLNNLGYDCGEQDGVVGEKAREALQDFQREHELEVMDDSSVEVNEETRAKLSEAHFS